MRREHTWTRAKEPGCVGEKPGPEDHRNITCVYNIYSIHIYTYIYIYTHTYVYTYLYLCICVYIDVCICILEHKPKESPMSCSGMFKVYEAVAPYWPHGTIVLVILANKTQAFPHLLAL